MGSKASVHSLRGLYLSRGLFISSCIKQRASFQPAATEKLSASRASKDQFSWQFLAPCVCTTARLWLSTARLLGALSSARAQQTTMHRGLINVSAVVEEINAQTSTKLGGRPNKLQEERKRRTPFSNVELKTRHYGRFDFAAEPRSLGFEAPPANSSCHIHVAGPTIDRNT